MANIFKPKKKKEVYEADDQSDAALAYLSKLEYELENRNKYYNESGIDHEDEDEDENDNELNESDELENDDNWDLDDDEDSDEDDDF